MKRLVIVVMFFLVFVASSANAEEWVSPIDIKYKKNYPELFTKYTVARSLLNNYRGRTDDLISVVELLDNILDSEIRFAPAYREYGRLMIMAGHISYDQHKNGSLGSAESAILESINIEPDYADAYVLLGHLYTRMNDYPKATVSLSKADEIGTKSPWLHMNWADLLKKQRKYDEAMMRYKLVVESNTDNRKAFNQSLLSIALLYRNNGDYNDAKEWYEKAINYERSAWNFSEYGDFMLFYYNDIDEAIKLFEVALSIMEFGLGRHLYSCALYTKWASLYVEGGDNSEALKYYNKAFKIQPDLNVITNEIKKHGTSSKTYKLLMKTEAERNGSKV